MIEEQAIEEPQDAGTLVRLLDQPPAIMPGIVLDELVPFPGALIPVMLGSQRRRDAVLHAKSNHGFLFLINHVTASATSGLSSFMGSLVSEDVVNTEAEQGPEHLTGVDNDDVDDDDQEEQQIDSETIVVGGNAVVVDVHVDPDNAGSGNGSGRAEDAVLGIEDLSEVGIVARVVRVFKLPDDRMAALVQLLRRAKPVKLKKIEPFPVLQLMYPAESVTDEKAFEATFRQVRLKLKDFFDVHPSVPDELKLAALAIENSSTLADFVAQHLSRNFEERLRFLVELDLAKRMHHALEVVLRELDMLTVGNRISDEIRTKVEKHQRDFLLREQLKAIRVELGEEKDPGTLAVSELTEQLDKAGLPEVVRERADDELKRLSMVPVESPEHNVIRSYLDWIASLPWSKVSEDQDDIKLARQVLEEDHYGLDEVKKRIVEFLAVRQLNPDSKGSLLCFAGPPGVGKTSLGESIARALGRKFYRFSVGGMRDEAEIKGHRRTYIGAMPGRLLQALKQVGTANPVIMLDEIDKMGSDWRGDPSSAMLEVLDPAQNVNFLDHYLDLPFDLSRVMFIATANVKTEIPGPLLDRLEVIDLPGYIPEEKLEIGMRYLFQRQRQEHGLKASQIQVGRPIVKHLITEYTFESGVRELDRLLGKLCRKRATELVAGDKNKARIALDDVKKYLGSPKRHDDRLYRPGVPGVVMGLAWTAAGGDVLFIEAAKMEGKGQVKVTGQLGDVMNESTSLAGSYVRHRAESLGIDTEVFEKFDLHLHFPAGAVPKDGPSAGVTITTALISLLCQQVVKPRIAMTGEIALHGEVLPVGGIREKVVAARRVGVRTIIVPERNRVDVEEIPKEVTKGINFVYAAHYDDILPVVFPKRRASTKTKKVVKKTTKKKTTKKKTRGRNG